LRNDGERRCYHETHDRFTLLAVSKAPLVSALKHEARRTPMAQPEQVEVLIFGSGAAGKLLAWHLAQSGKRTAVVERKWIGGSCPNIACLPSKNEIRSAEIAHLARHGAEFGTGTGPVKVDMATVRRRKRDMVEGLVAIHLQNYKASGAELIMGEGASWRRKRSRLR
jgi:pyruvate/2-oxoglutarate dehydrogenase complex dihydrolipoamide dehydrogenase (E3) component